MRAARRRAASSARLAELTSQLNPLRTHSCSASSSGVVAICGGSIPRSDNEASERSDGKIRSPARCCDKTGFTTYDYPGSPGNAVQTAGHRIYNPDNVDCEVADVTTDGAASQSRRQLQSDEPYLMSEAIDQLVEEFGGEDAILASIPYE